MGNVSGKAAVNRNTVNPTRGQGKYATVGNGAGGSTNFGWAGVSGPKIKEAIGFVIASGDAITFGRTYDGGALSITILSGSDRIKRYAATVAEAEQLLSQIIDACGPSV